MLSQETIKTLDRRHIIHSWSVQAAVNPRVLERGEGVHFWDGDGKRYLDFSSALVNLSVGYQHPKVIQAMKDEAEKICYARPDWACDSRSRLGRDLAAVTPGDLDRFFFTTAGADANENAVKIARAYTGKSKILAKYRSYHGATYGAITLTGDFRRPPVEPGIPGVVHFLDPFCYRCPFGLTHPDCDLRCAEHVDEIIRYESPKTVAAVLLETHTGGAGFFAPPDGYYQRLREICDAHDVLLVLDEVMVGLGRTGEWFAIDHYDGVVPDMMTLAKGLTCGYIPLGCVAVSDRIMEKLDQEMLYVGLTYSAHPLACGTASAVLGVLHEEKLVENARRLGDVVRRQLEEVKARRRCVGDVRGTGLFFCLDLVADRATREPLSPALAGGVQKRLLERGLSTNVMGNLLFVGPPLIITEKELTEGIAIIDEVLGGIDAELA
ncbi:MAG: aminotransferase class III-fold pyridoxal phosphate-dependent enzyme [Thermoleophilia bacterium]|jgi:taurine--2-oxoglutarate transaminase|nr:aminotransferase class III-fold pyridoxal phosphate-dependent enzyme [Thermoleophilia bacterium]